MHYKSLRKPTIALLVGKCETLPTHFFPESAIRMRTLAEEFEKLSV